jgi:hypothetical protein
MTSTRQVRKATLDSLNALYKWQFPTVYDGIEQGSILLERNSRYHRFLTKHFSRELILLFAKIMTSKPDDASTTQLIPRYLLTALNYKQTQFQWLFSVTLNRPLLRILDCDETQPPNITMCRDVIIKLLNLVW